MTMRIHNVISLVVMAVAIGPTVTMLQAQRPPMRPRSFPCGRSVDGNFRIAPPTCRTWRSPKAQRAEGSRDPLYDELRREPDLSHGTGGPRRWR